jgi:hypothetical protein
MVKAEAWPTSRDTGWRADTDAEDTPFARRE